MDKKNYTLRSHRWFWGQNETGILHQGALRSAGINMDHYDGQPVIGIANTWSELNNCNMSLRRIAEIVKEGIIQAGGIPLEFPAMSLGEELMKPTAGLYRNLLSIEIEEIIRANPIDGIVLLGNCDKTVPGLLMGAISANIPTIQLNGGPKKVGTFKGQRLGSGTDLWKFWDEHRIGKITDKEWNEVGKSLSCGFGACNTMGTASTMNGLIEALGLMPLGLSTLPVESDKRNTISRNAGKRIVEMVHKNLRPSDILTWDAFENAVKLCMALGGSTNAVLHLTAIAGRLNLNLYPEVFNAAGKMIPCITDTQPVGQKLIDEFDEAGGIPAVLKQLKTVINLNVITYTGETLGKQIEDFIIKNASIIRPLDNPVAPAPSLAIITGNLAPKGAVIKIAAASKQLFIHTGKAVVFENYNDMLARIDSDNLDVEATSVLVLKNAGPKAAGMPEWGMIPIPKKLRDQGVTDMVRISDARMSGTSFGTVILHVCPESFVGGPLSIVKDGDPIKLDLEQRKLSLLISDEELTERMREWKQPVAIHKRGFLKLFAREILQADEGCDFEFLRPRNDEDKIFIEPIVGRS